MPTSTFFRLPEEKRQRLLTAAREEFSRTSFDEVSINRFIRRANIPRGSFYQYFADKKDLFHYLLQDIRDYFLQNFLEILGEGKGDLFAVPLGIYDRLVGGGAGMDPVLRGCIAIMRANPRMDMCWLLGEQRELIPQCLYERLDVSDFRQPDLLSVSHVFFLIIQPLVHAIMGTLAHPGEDRSHQRELLIQRVEIIKYGSLRADKEDRT